MRRAAPLALIALAALGLSACESTQSQSARLKKDGKGLLRQHGLTISKENADVRVSGTTVLRDANGAAVVVDLRNRGARDQADVPVLVAVKDIKGKAVYKNDAPGLESSLVSVPLLPAGKESFWVDNQVTAARPPKSAEATIGAARKPAPKSVPRIEISKVRFESDSDGVFVTGVVANRSKVEQRRLVISCVARRGGRVVAAGRAVIDKLAPAPTPKLVHFSVYFIGNPKGAKLTFSAPPVNY